MKDSRPTLALPDLDVIAGPDATAVIAADLQSLLRPLSLARGQIILDQWESVLTSPRQKLLPMAAMAKTSGGQSNPIAVLAATWDDGSDSATILLGGVAGHPAITGVVEAIDNHLNYPSFPYHAMRHLADLASQQMRDAGVKFVQWATDPVHTENHLGDAGAGRIDVDPMTSLAMLPGRLGFHFLANLNYLAIDLDEAERVATRLGGADPAGKIHFYPVDFAADSLAKFISLVDQTYAQTLDCPKLFGMRSTEQIIQSYRGMDSFAPTGWMVAHDGRDNVGVLVISLHGGAAGSAAEITYMGVLPRHRGRGIGSRLVEKAKQWAQMAGCGRLLLAVDAANEPAGGVYRRAGFAKILGESVWAQNI